MEERLNPPVPIGGTKLIIGVFLVIHGLLLTADNLDLLNAARLLRYWPAIILGIGLMKLADPARRLAGAILTVLGASLLAATAGWVRFTIVDLWPALLILGGLAMVARAFGVRMPETSPDSGNVWAVLTTRHIANLSRDFSGARIVAFMGGCTIDLPPADSAYAPAVIEAYAMWGGLEIYVPDGWEVIGEVVPVMAGFEVKVAPTVAPQRQLIIRGGLLMAGIEVKRRLA